MAWLVWALSLMVTLLTTTVGWDTAPTTLRRSCCHDYRTWLGRKSDICPLVCVCLEDLLIPQTGPKKKKSLDVSLFYRPWCALQWCVLDQMFSGQHGSPLSIHHQTVWLFVSYSLFSMLYSLLSLILSIPVSIFTLQICSFSIAHSLWFLCLFLPFSGMCCRNTKSSSLG